jgi:hypothetical protein
MFSSPLFCRLLSHISLIVLAASTIVFVATIGMALSYPLRPIPDGLFCLPVLSMICALSTGILWLQACEALSEGAEQPAPAQESDQTQAQMASRVPATGQMYFQALIAAPPATAQETSAQSGFVGLAENDEDIDSEDLRLA